MLIGTIDFLPLDITFTDLELSWASQGLRKAKLLGFIFSQSFQLIMIKIDLVLDQLRLNILIVCLLQM